jgi:hypothetical protein
MSYSEDLSRIFDQRTQAQPAQLPPMQADLQRLDEALAGMLPKLPGQLQKVKDHLDPAKPLRRNFIAAVFGKKESFDGLDAEARTYTLALPDASHVAAAGDVGSVLMGDKRDMARHEKQKHESAAMIAAYHTALQASPAYQDLMALCREMDVKADVAVTPTSYSTGFDDYMRYHTRLTFTLDAPFEAPKPAIAPKAQAPGL